VTATVLLKRGNDRIAVYVPKETILKMAGKIEQVKPAFLFDLVREISDNTS
jgi:hypothetical protein